MRAVCKRLVAACAYGVLTWHLPAVGSAVAAPPTWAYPVDPPAGATEPPLRLAGELRHVPDSRVTFSNAGPNDEDRDRDVEPAG
jgi:hypothetical protein